MHEPMTTLSTSRTRRWLLLALAVVLALPLAVSAQDHPDRAERLKQALGLTDAQVALVEEAVGDEAEPGDLWAVAAALAPTLTDAQKEKLFTRPERPARDGKVRGRRADHPERPHHPERPERVRLDDDARAERREEVREAVKADMRAALGLTDAQVQQLDALHAERRAERQAEREARREQREGLREEMRQRRAERSAPGELPEEVAAILTPEQQEIARVHRALAAHAMRGWHRHDGHHRHGGRH